MVNILRQPTSEELKDFVDISRPLSQRDALRKKIMQYAKDLEAKHTKEYTPYDYPCAKYDFEKAYKDYVAEVGIRTENIRQEEVERLSKFDFDFDKYSDKTRLKLIAVNENQEHRIQQGTKVTETSGYTEVYICPRGHRIKVFIPIEVYKERKEVKIVDKEVKEVKTKK